MVGKQTKEIDRYKHRVLELDLPLTSNVDPYKLRKELGVPDYVDLGYFPMQRAVVVFHAARHANEFSDEKGIVSERPIDVTVFGGAAFKFHCPSCNEGYLKRDVHDVDFVIKSGYGRKFIRLLTLLGSVYGSRYTHYEQCPEDVEFNSMGRAWRYRVRAINSIEEDGSGIFGEVDIICDKIKLRHAMDFTETLKHPQENLYTVGLVGMIISKCQVIDMAKKDQLIGSGEGWRVLPYDLIPGYAVIGMERKDLKDIYALFNDHELGEGPEEIDVKKLSKILGDKKLRKTVRLNLEFAAESVDREQFADMGEPYKSRISERIKELLGKLPESTEKWSSPWWETAVETPRGL